MEIFLLRINLSLIFYPILKDDLNWGLTPIIFLKILLHCSMLSVLC